MSRVAEEEDEEEEEEGGGNKIEEKKLNGNINWCQSIPGFVAAGEESEGERHIQKERENTWKHRH